MQIIKKLSGNNRGSILVGVVVLSTIMAIGTAGLIGVARNTHNQSVDAYEETQLFLAAEAGLHIGTSWYRTMEPVPAVGEGFDMAHDGIPVRVEIQESQEDPGMVRITSTANLKSLPYTKMLEWTVTENDGEGITSGHFGYFIDDARDGKGAANWDKNFQGFRGTSVFDCPVHFNGALWIKNNDDPIFRGMVSLYNPADGSGYSNRYDPDGKSVRNKNQYNKGGLSLPNGSSPENNVERDMVGRLDNIFQNKLLVTEEKYTVNFKTTPEISGPDADGVVWQKLPASKTTNSLRFNGTYATYTYTADSLGANNKTTQVNKTLTFDIPQNGTEMIIHAEFPLTVTDGNMTGIVSVRTTEGNDITLNLAAGKNLVYTGASIWGGVENKNSNYGVGNERPDLLAFYSGKDIKLEHAGNHHITAQLIAKTGQIIIPNWNAGSKNYTYEIVGNMVAKYWWNYSNAGSFDNCLKLWHDQRQLNAPGVSLAGSEGGDGSFGNNVPQVFTKIRWRETNLPRR
ncbi:MAG: hypothetical protein FWE57_06620 [Chitinispirillia bacterium]|nr:hypothetical protein [Chitinispirillia bacterium]